MGNATLRRAATVAITVVLALSIFIGPMGTISAGAETLTGRVLRLVNHSRAAHGLRPLRLNARLSQFAGRHSDRMASADRLFHSSRILRALRPYDWSSWGENVGCGTTLREIHGMFMHSVSHRENILDRSYRRVAIGVVVAPGSGECRRTRFWVTEIFYG